ncbi:MAG: N-acetylmuramoyl-L-alanine amidase [Acidimicrobiaceae bacterium]|nr:N-acetylmuramoyl-L-alanine amidase [Acidimicrobiaceae bacterium]
MQIDTSHTSPNQTPGRQGVRVDRIVWHHTGGGSVAGAINWVVRPESQVSYHYLVDESGRIFRVVPEQNTSWHAGNWTMNLRSIGICHPVNGGGAATRQSSVALARDICRRFGIPPDGGHIIPHRAVVPTACPGALPMAEWIALVAAPEPAPPGLPLHSGGNGMIAILSSPTRADVFAVGSDGQVWWHAGPGTQAALASPGVPCGGDVRAISGTYWSDYSHIDLVAITAGGSVQMGRAAIANRTFQWAAPALPGPAMTPVGFIPPAALPPPLR